MKRAKMAKYQTYQCKTCGIKRQGWSSAKPTTWASKERCHKCHTATANGIPIEQESW